jgi:hypothetical protein
MSDNQVPPSLFSRTVTAVKYAITGKPTWFGPGQPMAPQAQEAAGRTWDYAPSINLQQAPRLDEEISADELRALATNCDVMALVIGTRKDQLTGLTWSFQMKDKTARKTVDPRIKMLTEFFEMPDREHSWDQWISAILDDLLVIDAPTVYPRRTRDGGIYGFDYVDGATIVRKFDEFGRTPMAPQPAYQQRLHGLAAVDYAVNELIYMPRTPRTYKAYGLSPVQMVAWTANIALRRQSFQLDFYTSGSMPDAVVGLPDSWSSSKVEDYDRRFNQLLSGDGSQRRKVKFMHASAASSFKQLKEAVLKDEFDEWLARVVCYAFSVSPQAFVKETNRGTGETAQAMANAEGLAPLRRWVKSFINRCILVGWGWTDIEFAWHEEEETNPQEQAVTSTTYMKNGVLLINEVRADIGREPIPGGDTPLIFTPTGAVPLSVAIEPPKPEPAPQIGHNGGPTMDGKQGTEADQEEQLLTKAAKGEGRLQAIWQVFLAHEGARAAKALSHLAPTAVEVAKAAGDDAASDPTDPTAAATPPASDDVIDASIDQTIRSMAWPVVQSGTVQMLEEAAIGGVSAGEATLGQVIGISVASKPASGGGMSQIMLDATRLANPRAVAAAQAQAAELVSGVEQTTRDNLRRLVVQAQAEGWSTKRLADAIASDYTFSADRAWVIARTELARSSTAGNIEGWRQAAKLGVNIQKRVILGQNENHCLVCTGAVLEGAIPLDDSWAAGFQTPFHPSCYCTLTPVVGGSVSKAFSPDQPRGPNGKWVAGGAVADVDGEIQRGRKAISEAMQGKTNRVNAMQSEVGPVSFLWGHTNGTARDKGGFGLAHIINKRSHEGVDGTALINRIPEAIAKGQGHQDHLGSWIIEHNGDRLVLEKGGNGTPAPWVLTAYTPKK